MADARGERVGVVVIHGVGDAWPGWTNQFLVPELRRRAPGLELSPHSEVYEVKDAGSSKRGATFQAFLRRGRLEAGQEITLAELNWSDLSRIGAGRIAQFMVMLQLFFEAPQVLASAFLRGSKGPVHLLLWAMIWAANWLLRWPIAGLNVCVFSAAFTVIALEQVSLARTLPLPITVAIVLGVLLAIGFYYARQKVHREVGPTDLALSTVYVAALLLAALAVAHLRLPASELASADLYLALAAAAILIAWTLWTVVVMVAILIIAVLAVKQLVIGAGRREPRAMRAAAAVGLNIIQGTLWKVVVAPLGVLVIGRLVPGSVIPGLCPQSAQMVQYLAVRIPDVPLQCVLGQVNDILLGVAIFNLLMIGAVLTAFMALVALRWGLRWLYPRRVIEQRLALPRMIVSPWITLVLLAGAIINAVIFYTGGYDRIDAFRGLVRNLREDGVLAFLAGGTGALSAFLYVIGALRSASVGIMHIARDIVDHQYEPRFTMSRMVLKKKDRRRGRYPRRDRIHLRFEALMDGVVKQQAFDRIVFLAHSQGTVILYDYLRSRDDHQALLATSRVDVITLGSPLSNLYQYYFSEYERSAPEAGALHPRLASWTNMWRIDDPVGSNVGVVAGGFIQNVALPAGGHTNYWREERVANKLLALIAGQNQVPGLPQR